MVLRMTRPTKRTDSSFLTFRKRIPADLQKKARGRHVTFQFPEVGSDNPAFTVMALMGKEEVKVSLRTRDPAVAKARSGVAEAHLQQVWAAIRSGPKRLTHKQIVALSGEIYRDFTTAIEDDPGSAALWQRVIEENALAARGGFASPLRINQSEPSRLAASLEARYGNFVDVALQRKALEIDPDDRVQLLHQFGTALTDAAKKLKRNAEGDYTPDQTAARFPAWQPDRAIPSRPLAGTLTGLVEDWWKEQQREDGAKPSTYESYSATMRMFVAFLGHDDPGRITTEDVIAFKGHRLTHVNPRTGKAVSARTVQNNDLAGLRSIFGWACSNKRMAFNPASGVTVKIRAKPTLRDKEFTDAEATAILTAAWCYQPSSREHRQTAAAKRWVPWLCAYSGARVGEMVQLRKEDVRQEGGVWVMRITPEAGTVKTNEAREVALHLHLVELGFPAFVAGSKDGHLFFTPTATGGTGGPWQTVKNRMREFVRTIVADPNVAPNHGWRHKFKTIGIEAGIEERVLDAIQGHKPQTVSRKYGSVSLKARADAMEKFPRFRLDGE